MGFEMEKIASAVGGTGNGFELERIAENVGSGSGSGGTSGGGLLTVYIIPYEGEDPNNEYEALSLTADEENPELLTPNDVFNADGTLKTTLTVRQRFSGEDGGSEIIGYSILSVDSASVVIDETQEVSAYYITINHHEFFAEGAQSYFVYGDGGK